MNRRGFFVALAASVVAFCATEEKPIDVRFTGKVATLKTGFYRFENVGNGMLRLTAPNGSRIYTKFSDKITIEEFRRWVQLVS